MNEQQRERGIRNIWNDDGLAQTAWKMEMIEQD